jgi:hypothetical protein
MTYDHSKTIELISSLREDVLILCSTLPKKRLADDRDDPVIRSLAEKNNHGYVVNEPNLFDTPYWLTFAIDGLRNDPDRHSLAFLAKGLGQIKDSFNEEAKLKVETLNKVPETELQAQRNLIKNYQDYSARCDAILEKMFAL